jgi:hypothetical protein
MDEQTERTRDEGRKWKLAERLNKRYPQMCWADLVMWSEGDKEWEGVNTQGRCGSSENIDFVRMGSCWCGKFNRNEQDNK